MKIRAKFPDRVPVRVSVSPSYARRFRYMSLALIRLPLDLNLYSFIRLMNALI